MYNLDCPAVNSDEIDVLEKSFEIFSHVNITCPIIFTTAYDQYAIKAFEQNSISYLLKPITSEKLHAAFMKLETMKKSFHVDIQKLLHFRNVFK